jgi:ELWxxDGT repeat protein
MIRQTVLFGGYDASGAAGTWATNGTAAGTYELTGIGKNQSFSLPGDFNSFNGEGFYSAVDASGVPGLWETNGTTGGTSEISISGTSSTGLDPGNLTVLSSVLHLQPATLLFTGVDTSGFTGLWVTNGTAAGTSELGGLGSQGISGVSFNGLLPEFLTAFSPNVVTEEVLFQGLGDSNFPSLWVTNGTAAGTSEVGGLSNHGISGAFALGIEFSEPVVFGQEVLFGGLDKSAAFGLWVTNGTAAGTTEVGGLRDTGIIGASSSGINPTDMTLFNGEVIFDGTNSLGVQGLWLTDGTAADTHEIVGIGGVDVSGLFAGGFPDFIAYNGKVLFQGEDASGNVNLWVSNGTASGTSELTGISGASTGSFFQSDALPSFTIFNGEVLFSGTDASSNVGLWVTNGTAAGTHELIGGGRSPRNEAAVTITVSPPDDFTGNNISDILFRDTTSGDTWVEVVKVFTVVVDTSWNQIGGSNTSFSVAGTGDFYGTGTSDILFRNNSTGDTWFEAVSNGAFAGWHQIGGSDTTYPVAGLGDFSGYGTSDILFRNTSTGDTWIEAISNGAFNGWHQVGGSDTHYSVVGVGDFFESGVDDILFRNNSTGDTWIEQMTNGAFAGWDQIGGSDTTYAVVGIGDYSGNGTSDILFRNSAGDTWVEQITNGAFFFWSHIGGSNTSYSVPVTVGPPALT